ncbi:HEAT repeat domain-containing protein [Sediminispirochaeta smaragdinae]|uniref:PBS lyase HEAT domain protein repeat-containing protein n=1 Tax=Sediminispirochaeta smaragdinae (strain DSM 11293 / JCM 15392 / SEBR 4228) TaxID=573413 RepID=E1R9P0_SEDSS|nr:HEAT repeat domain-containing protein [Sediminispirochaeta smaragdinae]ADK83209.1 PBS lyase HEAT domain protein repeat-containing protein [Sediminispirochaeta smaragdinae DSM 11293]
MNTPFSFLQEIPMWLLVVDASVVAILLLMIIVTLITFLRLRKSIRQAVESWHRYREKRPCRLSVAVLELFGRTLEKRSMESGVNLFQIFGLEKRMIGRISVEGKQKAPHKRVSRTDIRRALAFFPDQALFPIFLLAQKRRKVALELESWLEGAGELFVLRRLAISSGGTDFDGKQALRLLESHTEEIWALAEDPDYRARLFALRIAAAGHQEQDRLVVHKAFSDEHPEIRIATIRLYIPEEEERDAFYKHLIEVMKEDPNHQVRITASGRLYKEFPDAKLPEAETLNTIEAIRIAELLNPDRSEDQNLAFKFLLSDDPELSLIAARFLDACGAFSRLFMAADSGDEDGMRRIEKLLRKGAISHCFGYLNVLSQQTPLSTASLVLASRLLLREGARPLIGALLKRFSALPKEKQQSSEGREIVLNTLEAATKRGDEEAMKMAAHMLLTHPYDEALQRTIIENISRSYADLFIEALLELLKNPDYQEEALLISKFAELPADLSVHALLDLVRLPGEVPLIGRKRAIKVLLRKGERAGIQGILEEMPLMELNEAAECAGWLEQFIPTGLEERLAAIFSCNDGPLRARMIAAIPSSLIKRFNEAITEALDDPDPEVRKAAAIALFDQKKKKVMALLHDPVPQVRETVAALAGRTITSLEELKELVMDPNEVASVKQAALKGIASAGDKEAADFLLAVLEKELEIEEEIIDAAAGFDKGSEFEPFVRRLETAPDDLREKILKVLIASGERGEAALLSLLEEPVPLRDSAAAALEAIGTVERTMRRLSARNPDIRLEAAQLLSRIGTNGAYRGIVLAVKDPSEKVRVEATKALQALKDQRGLTVLEHLTRDPVPRVRRYARWAKERLKAEALN